MKRKAEEPVVAPPRVTYWAISILSSRTFWLNAVALAVAVLSVDELVVLIPPRWMPAYGALVAVLNIVLRTQTVRPAALIPPGDTKAIRVPKIDPPAPPTITD